MGLICTDGAPALIGHRSGFASLMKQVAPHIVPNHCAIHKYTLACKTIPLELKSVLDSVVKAVNFIRGSAVNSRPFKAFCDDLGKEHQYFLFHTEVRRLSLGNVFSRVAELVTKVTVFLREHGSVELATCIFSSSSYCWVSMVLVRHNQRMGTEGLPFYHPNLLCCLDQMLAVIELSQHLVSSSRTVRFIIPRGARCVGHVKILWSAVC